MTGAKAAGPMPPLQYLQTIAEWVRDKQRGKPMTWAHVAYMSLQYALRYSSWRGEQLPRKLRDETREMLDRVEIEPAEERLESSLPAAASLLAQYEKKNRDISPLLLHERFLFFLATRPALGALNDSTVDWWQARLDAHGIRPEHFEGRAPWSPAAPTTTNDKDRAENLDELDELVGLENVRKQVDELRDLLTIQSFRREVGLPEDDEQSLHLALLGNPGTGKTSVARILAKIYHRLGLVGKAEVHEVDRSGLVAEFVGKTAIKTNEEIDKAMNGILFIDEAYDLAKEDNEDFGGEAITTLLRRMEENRNELVVFVAGYPHKMEKFLKSNPGLRSRFTRDLIFKDYSDDELGEIFRRRAEKFGFSMDDGVLPVVRAHLAGLRENRGEDFGNAREVRNLWGSARRRQSTRLMKERAAGADIVDAGVLSRLTADDVAGAAADILPPGDV